MVDSDYAGEKFYLYVSCDYSEYQSNVKVASLGIPEYINDRAEREDSYDELTGFRLCRREVK